MTILGEMGQDLRVKTRDNPRIDLSPKLVFFLDFPDTKDVNYTVTINLTEGTKSEFKSPKNANTLGEACL